MTTTPSHEAAGEAGPEAEAPAPLAARPGWRIPRLGPRAVVLVSLAAAAGIPGALFASLLFLTPLLRPRVLDAMLREGFGVEALPGWPWHHALALVLLAFLMVSFGAAFSGVISWWERRVAGRIQSRIGPNRAGTGGFFVWIAENAVKLLLTFPRPSPSWWRASPPSTAACGTCSSSWRSGATST